ncbi:ABC transporter substrate-binding protein [Clostridium tarantellae]|uniref:ABC transporter substrate-binding protein n=1 Tax=Clostridium tarantellae TaxID=39493 RepID=A0A6I1MLS4_9CLOT|nr:ABC transporter substrate-binding protein [Clostridium tarantellae]MPQ43954.1 ABC transporter substrate-binding protein [Clostridium tarantellae]
MKLNRKISYILLFFIIISFTSCKTNNNKDLIKIRLNEVTRSVFYSPLYVAINNGFFKEEGLEIELSTGQGADKTMQQVLSKNADIGFCGPEQCVYIYNQGKEDYGVVFAQLTQKDGSFLVGRNNDEKFNWSSLKGKTIIGGRPGGMPQMNLEYALKTHDLDPSKDVEIITNLALNATSGAFKSGTADYVTLFEPNATVLEETGSGKILASVGEAAGNVPYTCFFATKSYIEENADIIEKFTNAIYKGQIWIQEHSNEEISKCISSFFPGIEISTITNVITNYKKINALSKTPKIKEEDYNRMLDIIETSNPNLLPNRPPFEEIINTSFSEKTIKNIKNN